MDLDDGGYADSDELLTQTPGVPVAGDRRKKRPSASSQRRQPTALPRSCRVPVIDALEKLKRYDVL